MIFANFWPLASNFKSFSLHITKTISTQSRSEQFWKKNTITLDSTLMKFQSKIIATSKQSNWYKMQDRPLFLALFYFYRVKESRYVHCFWYVMAIFLLLLTYVYYNGHMYIWWNRKHICIEAPFSGPILHSEYLFSLDIINRLSV